MPVQSETPEHKQIKAEIVATCLDLGYQTVKEYRGKGWRADVLAITRSDRVAFEVQLSPQSLAKTLQRQERYSKDSIKGCWLFHNPVAKLLDERPDLPLFYVSNKLGNGLTVSLSDRRDVPLHNFIEEFLAGNIKFCKTARTKPEQNVKLVFFEMPCWKCKAMNHIYFVDASFRAACNATIKPEEYLNVRRFSDGF
jgi:competence CoiA-like predicted nuclease